jgi:hypothetical protein
LRGEQQHLPFFRQALILAPGACSLYILQVPAIPFAAAMTRLRHARRVRI